MKENLFLLDHEQKIKSLYVSHLFLILKTLELTQNFRTFIPFTNTIIKESFLEVFLKYEMGNILLVNNDLKGQKSF